jgi:Undecaprenyl-phosphate glucose phosphotransferase
MLSSNIKFAQRFVLIIDLLMVFNAYFFAFAVRNTYFSSQYGFMKNFDSYLWILVVILVIWPLFFLATGSYYFLKKNELPFFTFIKPLLGNLGGFVALSGILYFIHDKNLSRLFLVIFAVAASLLLVIERIFIKGFLLLASLKFRKYLDSKNILIIGAGYVGRSYYERIKKYKLWGSNVIGFLDDRKETGKEKNPAAILGRIQDLEDVISARAINEVVIALPIDKYGLIRNIVDICDKEGIRTNILPAYSEDICASVEEIDGMPVIHVREVPLDYIHNRFIKRTFDILVSLILLLVFMPVMILVAVGVKFSSKGPVLFKQERVGAGNKTFMMYKYRSMRVQHKEEEKAQWTTAEDPRKTVFGSFIRKTSLDELPQLFNVLMGNMSIVGPRPERPYWVDKFKEEIPHYMMRHYIKSGITGWAQVNGWRGDSSIEERIKCDNYYIRNWSLFMDVKIMILTVFKGFMNGNAY